MTLFQIQDCLKTVQQSNPINALSDHSPVTGKIKLSPKCIVGGLVSSIRPLLDSISEGEAIYFMTDGAWSNIDIIENILNLTGPAAVSFCSWSIGTDALRKFTEWNISGLVTSVHVLLDQGLRNRKPEILQQATAAFKNLKLIKCHAKVAVIHNERFQFVISGSANLTRNPRKESGTIFRNSEVAAANLEWMGKEFESDH